MNRGILIVQKIGGKHYAEIFNTAADTDSVPADPTHIENSILDMQRNPLPVRVDFLPRGDGVASARTVFVDL